MDLFRASHQWATRPDDQRFLSVQAMRNVCAAYAAQAAEAEVNWNDLRVEAQGPDLHLTGKTDVKARVTHYAFGQLAARAEAPQAYVRTLPATLAAQNLNYGLARRADDATAKLLFHSNGGLLLRAATGKGYERVWNWEVCDRLLALEVDGWTPALPRADRIIPGLATSDTPDLYASDHDMFAFLCHGDARIGDGSPDGLIRGIIVDNSEVGDRSLGVMRFLYRFVCGNHIIWGAQDMIELRLAHRGKTIRERLDAYQVEIRRYLNASAREDEAKVQAVRGMLIGQTKEQVLDKLFGLRQIGLSRKALEAGYDAVVPEQDGDARSVWGMVNGLTRSSQAIPFADERQAVDRAAGRILQIAF